MSNQLSPILAEFAKTDKLVIDPQFYFNNHIDKAKKPTYEEEFYQFVSNPDVKITY